MTKPIQIKNLTLGEGLPKICVPLTGEKKETILEEGSAAILAGADLVEWRADYFEKLSDPEKIKEVLAELSSILGQTPLLFTIRTEKEGGRAGFSAEEYAACNLAAAETGMADIIDVEALDQKEEKAELIQALHEKKVLVLASSHDFQKTDSREKLLERFGHLDGTGADILKMAVMPREFEDVAALMQATNDMREQFTEKPLISIAMGDVGAMSRIAGENFGSCVTFGVVGKASAPGQLPVANLRILMEALHTKNMEKV